MLPRKQDSAPPLGAMVFVLENEVVDSLSMIGFVSVVIPVKTGIQNCQSPVWIPGLRYAAPGMTGWRSSFTSGPLPKMKGGLAGKGSVFRNLSR